MITLFSLVLGGTAFADTLPHGQVTPDTLNMFEAIRYYQVTGKAKGKDCQAAFDDAMADVKKKMGQQKVDTLVTIYDDDHGDWSPVTEINCIYKGKPDNVKSTVVKIGAVAVRQGTTAAFMPITGARVIEMLPTLVEGDMMPSMQLSQVSFREYRGGLYYGWNYSHSDTFTFTDNRNDRAVVVFREHVTGVLDFWAKRLTAMPEVTGTEIGIGAKRYNKKGETESERFVFLLPTTAVVAFNNGELSEQNVIDNGAVMHEADGNSVKMDVSMVSADD